MWLNYCTLIQLVMEQPYVQRARAFIEGLEPPSSIRIPDNIDDYAEQHIIKRLPFNKDLSYNAIRKRMNPIERNISMYSYRKPLPPATATNRSENIHPVVQPSASPAREYFIRVPEFLKEESPDRKKTILTRLESDYQRMKSKLREHKHIASPVPSRNTTPKPHRPGNVCLTKEQFQKELTSKKIHDQFGKEYYADLYIIKKCRENVIKNTLMDRKHTPELPPVESTYQPTEQLIDQWAKRLPQQKDLFNNIKNSGNISRKKVIQQRGYLHNAYYELAALNIQEKRNLKLHNRLQGRSAYTDLIE